MCIRDRVVNHLMNQIRIGVHQQFVVIQPPDFQVLGLDLLFKAEHRLADGIHNIKGGTV